MRPAGDVVLGAPEAGAEAPRRGDRVRQVAERLARWIGGGTERADTYRTVRQAMRRKKQLIAFHRSHWLLFCPHAIGSRRDGVYVLAYVVLGDRFFPSSEPPLSPNRWRWLPLNELWGVMLGPSRWVSAPDQPRPVLAGIVVEHEA